MSDAVTIRLARPAECELLSDLARRSKAVWGYDAQFMAACREELTVQPRWVADGDVFVAELDGVIAGVHALEASDEAGEVELGLLFVEPGRLRRGVGGALFRHAVETAYGRGFKRLVIQGDPNAADFYAALGARVVGERPSASIAGRSLPLLVVDLVEPPKHCNPHDNIQVKGEAVKRLCVFCGSSPGVRPAYVQAANALGRLLARRGIGVVYGGASIGVMGAVADGAIAGGGEVIGVIPEKLAIREVSHAGLSALHVVDSMHERKALMAELSDAFVALPGGIGTFEELFEVWTWAQLGMHAKPCALLDIERYYAPLLTFIEHSVSEGFLRPVYRDMLIVADDAESLLTRLAQWQPPPVKAWLAADET